MSYTSHPSPERSGSAPIASTDFLKRTCVYSANVDSFIGTSVDLLKIKVASAGGAAEWGCYHLPETGISCGIGTAAAPFLQK